MSAPSLSSEGDPAVPNPIDHLMQIACGYMPAACLYTTAKYAIADRLAGGPKPVSDLAHAAGLNEDALYRILRSISSLGVFCEVSPRTFANTDASEAMRSDAPGSIRDSVLWMANPLHLRVFAEFLHSVQTGGSALEKATGQKAFEFFKRNPEESEVFNASMSNLSGLFVGPVLDAYDFGALGTLADIGGGHGFLLTGILRRHPQLQGIVFDQAHVVSGAQPRIESLGLASRCKTVAGDFFQAVPPADAYVMKSIIHDWDDAHAVEILKNCAQAMTGRGKVLLIEIELPPANQPGLGKWVDMEMLAMAEGRERTQTEYRGLFGSAGLELTRVVRTRSPFSVIEAVKA